MIGSLLQGTLVGEPVERTTAAGAPFWTATIRVPCGGEALFVGLSTFAEVAGARLMRLHKGAPVAAVGMLEQTSWSDREGNERTGWRLAATEILTLDQARRRREQSS